MCRVRCHKIAEIGTKTQRLGGAFAAALHFDGEKRRIVDGDPAALGGCYEPIHTLGIAFQYGAEQLNQ